MKLEVWGLGHAGLVCAAGLAQRGHFVVGVDIDAARIARLNAGGTHFQEPGLAARVAATVASGHLVGVTPDGLGHATSDASILFLPTPSGIGGMLDTQFILAAASTPSGSPLLTAVSASNGAHLDACLQAIRGRPWRRLGLYGITNKAGSDDLRHSPVLALIGALHAPPGALWACDPDLGSDHAPLLRETHGVTLVADLPSLQRNVDLIVNFRSEALPLGRACAQLHFASFWQGKPPRDGGVR